MVFNTCTNIHFVHLKMFENQKKFHFEHFKQRNSMNLLLGIF